MSPSRRMGQRRGERVAPPPTKDHWDVVFATNEAAAGWELLGRHAPGPTNDCWQQLRTDPLQRDRRQNRLRDTLSKRSVSGKELEQWQYEVMGAGRVWYCPDPSERTVWVTNASVGHPKATE